MLYVTLIGSGIVLLSAFVSATRPPKPIRWPVFLLVAVVVNFLFFIIFSLALWLTTATLFIALVAWSYLREKWGRFLPYSAIALAAGYALPVGIGISYYAEARRLREQFPVESMGDRVPEPRPEYRLKVLSDPIARCLESLDNETQPQRPFNYRDYQLRQLHTDISETFVESPGFGVMRMGTPSWSGLTNYRKEGEKAQPGHRSGSDDLLKPSAVIRWPETIFLLHESNVVEFVNPRGFGLVDGRTKTIGFAGHGYGQLPASGDAHWSVATVELVSLLLHDEPAVYVSARLPAMDELKTAPTRAPDVFETAALEKVRAGEDLVAAETQDGNRMRMLGAIRNGKTCVKCHGGDRGDLLGAFSYVLSKK
jgi:hypothetical protein